MNRIYSLIFVTLIGITILLTACGESPGALLTDGNGAFAEAAYDDALRDYAAAQELAPTAAEPIYNIANTLYRQGSFTETQQVMPQALGLAAETVAQSGHYNLGNSHYQTAQWLDAVEAYKAALRLDPTDMDAKYNLELALRQLAQDEQAQQQADENQSADEESGDQESADQESADQGSEDEQSSAEQSASTDEQEQQSGNESADEESADQEPSAESAEGESAENSQTESAESEQPQDETAQDGQQEQAAEEQAQNEQSGEEVPSADEQQQTADTSDSTDGESADGEPSDAGQNPGQTTAVQPLTEEQARQLLGTIGRDTETLQERLQQIYISPGEPPEKDW